MSTKARTLAVVSALLVALPATGFPQASRPKPRNAAKPAEAKSAEGQPDDPAAETSPGLLDKVVKSDAEWRRQLTRPQYLVLRQKATEQPFTGKYAVGHFKGTFACAGCGAELFSATHKYNSGTGWPSFYRPIRAEALEQEMDYSAPETRVEVMCARCGGHLGHVFSDGPPPTGLRYCINSAALKLRQPAVKAKGKAARAPARGKAKAAAPKPDAAAGTGPDAEESDPAP
jgi:peptide-methionine (R)-S-oxide reductase